jgi:hypothetical protein
VVVVEEIETKKESNKTHIEGDGPKTGLDQ